MGKGWSLYPVERTIIGTEEMFGDGAHILYVNGAYRDDSPMGKLMHDFACTKPEEMKYKILAERTKYFKESKEGIAIMCKTMEEMRKQAMEEGIKKGMQKGLQKVVSRMHETGKYTKEEIAEISGVSIDEVQKMLEKQAV